MTDRKPREFLTDGHGLVEITEGILPIKVREVIENEHAFAEVASQSMREYEEWLRGKLNIENKAHKDLLSAPDWKSMAEELAEALKFANKNMIEIGATETGWGNKALAKFDEMKK